MNFEAFLPLLESHWEELEANLPDLEKNSIFKPILLVGSQDQGIEFIVNKILQKIYSENTDPKTWPWVQWIQEHKVQEIRDSLQELQMGQVLGKMRSVVFLEADRMNTQGFNSCLKTIEEPPQDVFILLTATEIDQLPATLVSRVMTIRIKPFTQKKLFSFLQQNFAQYSEETLLEIANLSQGRLNLIQNLDCIDEEILTKLLKIQPKDRFFMETWWNHFQDKKNSDFIVDFFVAKILQYAKKQKKIDPSLGAWLQRLEQNNQLAPGIQQKCAKLSLFFQGVT